ncbi:hypothetical protein HMPREF9983_02469 [Staphylococcus epidermidis NIHLM023]|nr:hypothetical protein HMPREF9983_02469 [Staphylococcus epidermidis NIHLM023]
MRDIFGIFRNKKKGFEEKLNEMYQEIANKINEMIPVEWERVYTMAYIDDQGGEVFLISSNPTVTTYITILVFQMIIMFLKEYLMNYQTNFTKILIDSESYL